MRGEGGLVRIRGRGAAVSPPNRFERLAYEPDAGLEDDPDAPPLRTELYRDATRSIISRNDSPDVGFTYSINPYRGCEHGCAYCLSGDTLILMADGRTRRLTDIRVGDEIYGTVRRGWYLRYVKTSVLAHWRTDKPAYRVVLLDGTELVASADHRFLTTKGWKHVAGAEPCLIVGDRLVGIGHGGPSPRRFAPPPSHEGRGVEGRNGALPPPPSWERGPGGEGPVGLGVAGAANRVRDIEGQAVKSGVNLRIAAVEPLGVRLPLFDITTGTGDFIANGVVSHNCYARPTHENLGFSSGLDFESRIMVKTEAPELLRKELSSRRWKPAMIAISGVTDAYQPVERRLRITRRCLEVLAECRNPVGVITKNHLVTRDADLLGELAAHRAAAVYLSITTLDPALQRALEPRASTPARRLDALRELSAAGIPVGVMVAPVIPGLTDHEMPAILEAAAGAGARTAGFVPLRLPFALKEMFEAWLEVHFPERKEKVLHRVREMRGGKLNETRFGERMRGEGAYAEQLRSLFHVACRRSGLNGERVELSTASFRRPDPGGQLGLF